MVELIVVVVYLCGFFFISREVYDFLGRRVLWVKLVVSVVCVVRRVLIMVSVLMFEVWDSKVLFFRDGVLFVVLIFLCLGIYIEFRFFSDM